MSQRKTISKQVVTSKAKIVEIEVVDGNIVSTDLPDIEVVGKLTMAKANRIAKRDNPKKNIAVLELEETITIYQMPLETFMEHATIKETETE